MFHSICVEKKVALATPTETREVLARPRASVPQAVLCAVDESKTGVGMDVPVTNGHGKQDSRYRYLFQVGTGTVVLDRSSLQLGARCTAKTVKAVLTLKKGAVSDAMWLRGIALDPEAVAREWLLAQGIKFLEVQRPRATGDGTMRMVLRLNKAAAETLMRMCGRDGVLTGKFIESEEDKNVFAGIPLTFLGRGRSNVRAFTVQSVGALFRRGMEKRWAIRVFRN